MGWHWGDPVPAVHEYAAKPEVRPVSRRADSLNYSSALTGPAETILKPELLDPCDVLRLLGPTSDGYRVWERADQEGLLESLITQWLASSGEDAEALRLIARYPDTPVTHRLREALLEHVAKVNPPHAARWLSTQPRRADRPTLLAAFARGLERADLRECEAAWTVAWEDGTLVGLDAEMQAPK
jgi:hypothetical protein